MWISKYSGSEVIVAKYADIGPPEAPQYFFQKKNLERSNYCSPRHIQAMLPLLALLKVSKMEQLEAM